MNVDERKNIVYLSIGSNLGDELMNLRIAVQQIAVRIGKVDRISSVWKSEAWGAENLNTFYNIVLKLESQLNPSKLLQKIHLIERAMGRKLKSDNEVYKNRIIDIDILIFNEENINTTNLTIPHKYMCERLFVLKPLAELLPNYVDKEGNSVSVLIEKQKTVNISKIGVLH